jgi:uncharacterized protein YbaR (Trm112 family)
MVSNDLFNVIVCPKCQGKVQQEEDALVCPSCALSYPVNEDIPVMLLDAAHKITHQIAKHGM